MDTSTNPVWLCHVHQLCWDKNNGGLNWQWRFISLPGPSKDAFKNRFSNDTFQIWDIYDIHRINRCAIAEQHCTDRAENPFNCHNPNL